MLNKIKKYSSSHTHEFFLLIVIVVFAVSLSIFTGGRFIQIDNLLDMLNGNAALGIMAAGMLVVIISGGIDMSFMAVATVSQYVMALFILNVGGNMFLAFFIPALVGAALGCVNAVLVHNLKAPAIITTIATMNAFYGVLMWLCKGQWLYGFPDWFSKKTPFSTVAMPVGALLIVFVVTAVILQYLPIGRKVFAIGDNQEAARRGGVNILATQIFVYSFMGVTASLGAVVQGNIIQNIAPNSLVGREMEVIAIVVLGGAKLTGGKGSVIGTFLGMLLIAMLGNGLVLLGISSYWHTFFMGAVILVSFCISGAELKKKKDREVSQVELQ